MIGTRNEINFEILFFLSVCTFFSFFFNYTWKMTHDDDDDDGDDDDDEQ